MQLQERSRRKRNQRKKNYQTSKDEIAGGAGGDTFIEVRVQAVCLKLCPQPAVQLMLAL